MTQRHIFACGDSFDKHPPISYSFFFFFFFLFYRRGSDLYESVIDTSYDFIPVHCVKMSNKNTERERERERDRERDTERGKVW